MGFAIAVLIASIFLADVLQVAAIDPTCTHLNEIYLPCSNGCEYTCDNYAVAGACAPGCDPNLKGCYCKPQMVRNRNHECVMPADCSKQPAPVKVVEPHQPPCEGPNERFRRGFLCTKTCATKDRMYKCKAGFQFGCFCNRGYLRNNRNECVPKDECDYDETNL